MKPIVINDKSIKSIYELSVELEKVDDSKFTSIKEEVYHFIKDEIGDIKLARQIKNLKYKENAVELIKDRHRYKRDVELVLEATEVQVNQNLYVNKIRLILDKEKCFRCDVSHTICPKEAVILEGNNITVDQGKCVLCGLCVPLCPSGCLTLYVDEGEGEKTDLYLETFGSIPKLPDLEVINDVEIKRLFTGNLLIDESKCPERCEKCVSACPINIMERDGKRVLFDDELCVLCGACMHACPEDAIQVKRNRILCKDEEGFSAVWTEVIEKLLGREKVNIDQNAKSMNKMIGLFKNNEELEKYTGSVK